MTTRSRSAPVALAVSLIAAKETLRIEVSDTTLDASITRWIQGITLDAEHRLGCSLVSQGWRLTLDQFGDALRLEHPPAIAVESIKFYDAANQLQTLSPADYYVDVITMPAYVVPAAGKAWPATFGRINAVVVDYTAGYGTSDVDVPANVQLYILARLAEQFDPATREFKETEQSKFTERLLDRAKVYG